MSSVLPTQKFDPNKELLRLRTQQQLEQLFFLIMMPPDIYLNTLYSQLLSDLHLLLTETQIAETEKLNDIKDRLDEYLDILTTFDPKSN